MSVSWLQAERYAAGELDPAERAAIEASDDPAVTAMLASIAADQRPLRRLPAPRRREWWAVPAVLAVAALAMLWQRGDGLPNAERGVKGGVLAIELVRDRDGRVEEGAQTALPGDRLKVRLTCPAGAPAFDVVVFQAGEASFPLERGTLTCGNRVALPGAFAVDGAATVCAVVDPPDRSALASGLGAAADRAVCARLRPP
jgi:hypothetical protein